MGGVSTRVNLGLKRQGDLDRVKVRSGFGADEGEADILREANFPNG